MCIRDSDDAKSKAIADFLNLQFVTIPRELPDAVEVIDEDGIDVYSNDNVKLKLSDISNYYFARLYYTKIARLLADKNIAFKAVRPTVVYVGLRLSLIHIYFVIEPQKVIDEGMIKEDVIVNEGISKEDRSMEDTDSRCV